MILFAALLYAAPAHPVPPVDAAQALSACRKISDAAARLSCFDGAAAKFDEAQEKGAVVVVDRKQVGEIRRQAFGLNVPSVTSLFRQQSGDSDNRLTAELASARQSPEGKWQLFTTEGQEWRQTDSESIANPAHAGSSLTVRRAALGSFFCKVDGQLAFRCTRER